MTRRSRVFYFGMITTDTYARAVGIKTYAGAATRKMFLVTRAMRYVGHRAVIVSLPFVGSGASRARYGKVVTSDAGVPAVFLETLRSKYLRKLYGPLLLASFSWRRVKQQDTVIVYNHAIEYIPALLSLRLRGIKTVQDIEDAPTQEERGLRGLLNRLSFAATLRLTAQRKMVVADHVARGLGLKDYVVIRGVSSQETDASLGPNTQKWDDLRAGQALKIHFGGTLISETGIDLFCAAVDRLAQDEGKLARPIVFSVTGIGELDKIRDLQARVQGSVKIDVALHPELDMAEYLALIDSCHASLSLKLPASELAHTTFPSKVIEITASGLALVSTQFGDVTEIFDDDSTFFLNAGEASNLSELILVIASDPDAIEQVARAGQAVCMGTFSPETVGNEMTRLIRDA